MAVLSRAAFRSGLADLAVGERARFVAALYRARGWTAEVDAGDSGSDTDAPVVTISRDGERRRLLVHEPGWLPAPLSLPASVPEGVDAVVTPLAGRPRGVPPGTTVIDGDALYERAVHGIDAAARDRLFESFLDRSPIDDRSGGSPNAPADLTAPAGSRPRWRTLHAVLGVVALGLVAAAVVGLPATDPGTQRTIGAGTGAGGIGTPTPFVGSDVDTDDGTPTADRTVTRAPPPDAYPPGIDGSGIVDVDALLNAHVRELATRHYRTVLTYEEYDQGRRSGYRQFVANVRQPALVSTSVVARGGGFGVADPVPTRELYANRNAVYYRDVVSNGTRYAVDRDSQFRLPEVAAFGTPYLARALEANSSRLLGTFVSNGTRLFRIRVSGDTNPQTEDAVGVLIVDSEGVVHTFRRRYGINGTEELGAAVSLQYEFEDVVVEPPPWLEEAKALLVNRSVAYARPDAVSANATDGADGTTGSDAAARAVDWLAGGGASTPAGRPDPEPS